MSFGNGAYTYEVQENWWKLPEEWSFGWITGVACDSQDRVYVYSRSEHPLVVFDRDGTFVKTIGDGILKNAHGIYIDGEDNIFLVDWLDHCVRKFDAEGNQVLVIGTPGVPSENDGDPFRKPTEAVVAPNGDIYVSDGYDNARVHRYDAEGNHIHSWGSWGDGPSQFALSHCVRIDRHDRLWVCDRENQRIQLFDLEGEFIEERHVPGKPDTVYFDPVEDIAYVAELEQQVGIYTLDGDLVSSWGGGRRSDRPGEFTGCPHGIWMDSHGDLYVGEVQADARLQKFVRTRG